MITEPKECECKLAISLAIGLFYSVAISGLVGWNANPWIDFPTPGVETLWRKDRDVDAVDFLLLNLLGGTVVGLLAGITRGRRAVIVASLGLGTAAGTTVTCRIRGWDLGGEFWTLIFAQITSVVASVSVCVPLLRFLQK